MTYDELVAGVLMQGGFDVAGSMAGGWLNEKHREAVAKAQWLQQELSLGVTVVNQSDYDIPAGVVDIVGLYLADTVTGLPSDWQRVSSTDMWAIRAGRSSIRGSGGVFAPKFGLAGEKRVELYPAPIVAGVAITALAAMVPAAMSGGASPILPEDMHGDLMDGAIGLGLVRMDERADSAASFEARFARMVMELRKRKNSRVGSQVSRMRVKNFDW